MHRLSKINRDEMTAVCEEDGLVKIRVRSRPERDSLLFECLPARARNAVRTNLRRRGAVFTEEELERILAISSCEACGSTYQLAVDHNHLSGALRGRLCGDCNRSAGLLRDSSTRLRALADYLDRTAAAAAISPGSATGSS